MEQEIRKRLALNIKVARIVRKITQKQLAQQIAISSEHITRIEACRTTPSIYVVWKIAKVLDIGIDDLLTKLLK